MPVDTRIKALLLLNQRRIQPWIKSRVALALWILKTQAPQIPQKQHRL
jgi:hypothetical protein